MAISNALRELIARRAEGWCEYCRIPDSHSNHDYAVEHVYPAVLGGSDDETNLAWSCQGCNSRKFTATHARDPLTGNNAPLYHPRRDRWEEHFRWSEDFLLMIGLTATGRATIDRLQLNRTVLINVRRALIAIGMHPPK